MLCPFLTGCRSEETILEDLASVQRYQYPIDVTSEDWFAYSVVEKVEMLKIPQETLDGMSDLQLLYAAADYPYFVDVSIYGFDPDSFSIYGNHCSAFGELLSRKSFLKSLETYGEAIAREYLADPGNHLDVARADLILGMMEVYTGSRPDVSDALEGYAD